MEGASLSVSTNGDENGEVAIVYTVTLSSINTTGSAITFDIDDLGTGTASSGIDYTAIPVNQKISVANGQQTGTYTVNVSDDSFEEGTETLILQISNPSDISTEIGTAIATAEIADDDVAYPGGVSSNLIFWLLSEEGTSTTSQGATLSSWLDQSGNSNDANEDAPGPTYNTVLDNCRPALDFSGSSLGGFTIPDDADINFGGNPFTAKSYFISFRTGSDVTSRQMVYEQGGGGTGFNMFIQSGVLNWNVYQSNTDFSSSGTSISANTNYLVTFIFDGDNNRWDAYLNGSSVANNTSTNSTIGTHSGNVGIGVINSNTQYPGPIDVANGEGFLGHIMEMVYYSDTAIQSGDRNIIESYLALKHGTTLNTDYTATDGSTIYWDNSANTGFNDHITGIGLDIGCWS